MSYAPYRQRDNQQEKADLERELAQVTAGFAFLRDFPEFGKSVKLAKEITKLLATVPPDKHLGWQDQLERSAVSCCCNISESVGRGTIPQLHQYMRIARGSAYETLACLYIAPVDVPAEVKDLSQEVCRLIDGTIKAIAKDRLARL